VAAIATPSSPPLDAVLHGHDQALADGPEAEPEDPETHPGRDLRRFTRERRQEPEREFDALRQVAVAHDARLRSGLTEAETELLAELLDKLRSGLEPDAEGHGSTR
jgi:hypothetical protein